MMVARTPYDEFPYRSYPVEWSAPEHLSLASLLAGGPRFDVDSPYRVLELGCGDGSNLLPLAFYRPHASFVGVDSAETRIDIARRKRALLGLHNVDLFACDLRDAGEILDAEFDVIIAHGLFSWIPPDARQALLRLCSNRLAVGGLIYLNYNARPGWNVRGLVRTFLLAHTAGMSDLRLRTDRARQISTRIASELDGGDHPFSQLLSNEFRFVGQNDASHTAHEYLAPDNEAFTRGEFLTLAASFDLAYVTDADFNRPSGRLPEELASRLEALGIPLAQHTEAGDLLCYRQLHSPILAREGFEVRSPSLAELSSLYLASCLIEETQGSPSVPTFRHPTGCLVEVRSTGIAAALRRVYPRWPDGCRLGEVVARLSDEIDDFLLLHRRGLIELRPSGSVDIDSGRLALVEREWGHFVTTRYHAHESIAAQDGQP